MQIVMEVIKRIWYPYEKNRLAADKDTTELVPSGKNQLLITKRLRSVTQIKKKQNHKPLSYFQT